MRFQGSVIKEQGVTFAIAIVKEYILNDRNAADKLIVSFQRLVFGNIPVVLMAQDYSGRARYYGRRDIVSFLSGVPIESIPWKEYTLN